MALSAGDRLGPYEIVAPLAAGGMGEVYRARDARLNRDVAIKVLPPWAAADPEMLRRFEVEARAVAAMNHPGIVSIHDIGHSDTGPFIVSELLEGETLREKLCRGPLTAAETTDVANQIVQALSAAHAQGIVHRDLKPENLFVRLDGRVKILDFGLARLLPNASPSAMTTLSPAVTSPGVVLGTYGYMSPEQACGRPADQRADIFSLGALLYEMLSGRRAFAGQSSIEVAHAVIHDSPPALTGVNPALQAIVSRCLEKDPRKRYESAAAVGLALNAALPASPAVLPGGPRARPGWMAVAIAATVLMAGAVAYVGWTRSPAAVPRRPITSIAVLPVADFSPTDREAYFGDSMMEAMIADLGRVSSISVTSRTSVMPYKETRKTMREIAQELGVQGLIEASFVRSGNRVVISASLVDARTGVQVWRQRFEREMQDVLAVQLEVARAISKEISAALTPTEERYLDEARSVDPAAHESYLRGRYELNRFTKESLHSAINHFNAAIAKDPESARAYAGLADAYTALRTAYVPPETVMPQAKVAATKAVALDGALAEARVALGGVLMYYDWDWVAAEEQFERATALNANLAAARQGYGLVLAVTGRHDEASDQLERALRLDPLSPLVRSDAAWIQYLGRRYDLVVEHAARSVELDPQYWFGYAMLGLGYEKLQRYQEATDALQKGRSLDDSPVILEMLGGLYATMGKVSEARRILAELDAQSRRRYVCPYEVATIHAGLGDRAEALNWLEKGKRERADCMPWIGVDPKLDLLRGEPGFQDLLRRAGIKTPTTSPPQPAAK